VPLYCDAIAQAATTGATRAWSIRAPTSARWTAPPRGSGRIVEGKLAEAQGSSGDAEEAPVRQLLPPGQLIAAEEAAQRGRPWLETAAERLGRDRLPPR
jgi:hypothetical protein